MLELVVRLVASLAVVVGLLMLLARFGGRKFRGAQDSPVHVVHRQPLSRTSSVAVVEVGGRVLVLGTTEQQVSILTELPAGAVQVDTAAVAAAGPVIAVPGPSSRPTRFGLPRGARRGAPTVRADAEQVAPLTEAGRTAPPTAGQPEPGTLDTDRIAALAALLERSLPLTDGPLTDGPLTDGPRTDGPVTDAPTAHPVVPATIPAPAPVGAAAAAVGGAAGRHRAEAPGRRAAVLPADQPEQVPSVAYAGRRAARAAAPTTQPAVPPTTVPAVAGTHAAAPAQVPVPVPVAVADAMSVLPPALAALARAEAEELVSATSDDVSDPAGSPEGLSPIDQLLAMLPEHPPTPEPAAAPVAASATRRARRAATDGSGPLAGSVLSPQTWRQAFTAVRRAS